MIKASRKKPARTSCPPKPLKTSWLDDDFYSSTTKPHSYAKKFTKYYVFSAEGRELYCFNRKKDAETQVRLIKGSWLHSFEPTEEQAHELRQKELAELRWNGGYGA